MTDAEKAKAEESGGFDVSVKQLIILTILVFGLIAVVAVKSFSSTKENAPTPTTQAPGQKKVPMLPAVVPSSQGTWKLNSQ